VKAFVTGGTGFVGSHLVRALLARGDDVTCLVRSPAKAAALDWPGVRLLRGTLDDDEALRNGCREAEVVFHVAGAIAARGAAGYMRLNRDGTARVLEAADAAAPGRLLYVSSQAAAGPNPRGQPMDETASPQPVTNYGRSKLAAELLVRAGTVPWTLVRPPAVYGERDREILKLFKVAATGVAPVFGDGSQELSTVYAGDLAEALIAAATAGATQRRLYYAAHPAVVTTAQLVGAVGAAMGKRVRVFRLPEVVGRGVLWAVGGLAALAAKATVLSPDKAAEFFAPAWTCHSDALARDAGWHARTALDVGLRRTADWYRAEGWL
jgi:nucleoside-diphosphate-sugar epimerase